MPKHLQMEIEALKTSILSLGAIVEEDVRQAVESLEKRDVSLARKVIEADEIIDRREVEVEEECLKILALYQPVAVDLRFIIAILKLNSDLERIGDLAVNIAQESLYLLAQASPSPLYSFGVMAAKAQRMVKNSLDSLVNQNAVLAHEVRAADDEIDALKRDVYRYVEEGVRQSPGNLAILAHQMAVAHNLERMADHATNIAEDVIYLVEGQIVRHSREPVC